MKIYINRLVRFYGIFILMLLVTCCFIVKLFASKSIIHTFIYDVLFVFFDLNFFELFIFIFFLISAFFFPIWFLLKSKQENHKPQMIFYTLFLFVFMLTCYSFFLNNPDFQMNGNYKSNSNNFIINRIAHAGGEIKNIDYTNSIDALNKSYEKGFRYFEIDFSFTEDDSLVCLHDWDSTFEKLFGFKTDKKLKLNEFKQLISEKSDFEICTLTSLIDWIEENPESYIITDAKENNLKVLDVISRSVPNFETRIIPQIYSPENFYEVKNMGYKQIIWTLYLYRYSNKNILNFIEQFNGSFAITMPKGRARSSLPRTLAKMNISSYTHTINLKEEEMLFRRNNITEIYTDTLNPFNI